MLGDPESANPNLSLVVMDTLYSVPGTKPVTTIRNKLVLVGNAAVDKANPFDLNTTDGTYELKSIVRFFINKLFNDY